jgi:hypothetical protein
MAAQFPWKRFWCRREDAYSLNDRGFLADPDENPQIRTIAAYAVGDVGTDAERQQLSDAT